MRARTGPAPRPGYTLIELLVVIAIIAILIALFTGAVQKVRGTVKRTSAVSEISQMDAAITSFKQKYNFIPPSYIIDQDSSGNTFVRRFVIPTRTQSSTGVTVPEYAILQRMFPRWTPVPTGATDPTLISPALAGAGTQLDPNQVMVYFLGGPGYVLGGGQATGWDVVGPTIPTGNTKTAAFYEFTQSRLVGVGTTTSPLRYIDPWGTPYAFFTGGSGAIPPSGGDNYEAAFMYPWKSTGTTTFPSVGSQESVQVLPTSSYTLYTMPAVKVPTKPAPSWDNTAGTPGLYLAHPVKVAGRWMNPSRVQIISAGPDLAFGPGSPYTAMATASSPSPQWYAVAFGGDASHYYDGTGPGADDLANFNGGVVLGATNQ